MTQVFLDTNIIVDFLAVRKEFYTNAAIIMSLGLNKKIKLQASAMSFGTVSYLLKKNDANTIKLLIKQFCTYCDIEIVDGDCVESATQSKFDDFEDAMQYRCAQKAKADYIVTRNTKDFKLSEIPALTPEEFLKEIISK